VPIAFAYTNCAPPCFVLSIVSSCFSANPRTIRVDPTAKTLAKDLMKRVYLPGTTRTYSSAARCSYLKVVGKQVA